MRESARHRIKVTDDVLNRLKKLKGSFGMRYSDIISMALVSLEDGPQAIEIESNITKVQVNLNKVRLDYTKILELLTRGIDIYIEGISRRQAQYIKSNIKKKIDMDVEILPVIVNGSDGWLFMSPLCMESDE